MIEQVLDGRNSKINCLGVEAYERSRKNRRSDIVVRKTLKMLSQEAKQKNEQMQIAFYLRVSTKNKSQEMALKEQQRYMERLEKEHPEWKVSWYIDFGKSGTNTNRQEFQRLLQDAENKKFTYIVAREVARFARNVSNSLVITDELRENFGIGAYFLFDDIDTLIMEDRSKFIDKAKQSEEEAWRTSKRVHATIDNQIEYDEDDKAFGPPRGSIPSFGFKIDRENKQHWLVDEEQAEVVKFIFNLAERGLSLKSIKIELEKQRMKNTKGEVKWHYSTIGKILRSPVYIGYQYQGKDIILPEGFLEKKKTRTAKENWILVDVKNYIPIIIAEEQYSKVQELLEEKRSDKFVKEKLEDIEVKKKDIWTSLLLCNCGNSFRLDGGQSNTKMSVYRCYNQINYGSVAVRKKAGLDITDACGIKSIAQWKLWLMFEKVIDLLIDNKETIIAKAISLYEEYCIAEKNDISESNVKLLHKEIRDINNRKKVLLSSFTEGYIDDKEYQEALKDLKRKSDVVNQKLEQIEMAKKKVSLFERSSDVREILIEILNDRNYNQYFIYDLVDLVVHQEDNKYLWFLNFYTDIKEADIKENDKMVFMKKSGFSIKRIIKSKNTLFRTLVIDINDARNYKHKENLGCVKSWNDLEVEIYL